MTPAFLKQTSQLEAVAEGDVESAERRRTWKRPIIMRSLSSMIKSLRKEEDDLLDDELRVLHEMEDQSEPVVVRATSPVVDESNLESRDSGVGVDQNLDQEGFLNVDVEEELRQVQAAEAAEAEENGRPKRVYKKKGQKRQTKRNKRTFLWPYCEFVTDIIAIVQPARRRAKQAQEEPEAEAESGVDVDATNAVATSKQPGDDELPTSEHSEFDDADLSEDVAKPIRKTKKAKQSSKAEPKDDANKAVRKINPNAQSHTNYRRLNIRGNNAKTGGKGRFSRRR
jgi:26S proteasome regulatory subunit N12